MIKRAIFVAVLAGFMTVGCGKKDGGDKGGDKAAEKSGDKAGEKGAAKAGKTAHEKLQGEWVFDVDKMIDSDPKMAEMIKAKPEMKAQISKMMEGASVVVTEKEIVKKMMGKEEKGTYTIVSQETNKITVKSKEEGKDKEETLTWEFTDDDTMVGQEEGSETKLHMTRKK